MSRILGQHIASGGHREVYEHVLCPGLVVKVGGFPSNPLANWHEATIWQLVDTHQLPERERLAPVVGLSADFQYLVQIRVMTDHPHSDDECVRLMPDWFRDVHSGNCGLYNGRLVLFDYGFRDMFSQLRKHLGVNIEEPKERTYARNGPGAA